MKRLAGYWLALALLLAAAGSAPISGIASTQRHTAAAICITTCRCRSLVREIGDCLTSKPARTQVQFSIRPNAAFIRIALFVFNLFERPPTVLTFSFNH